MHRHRQIIVSLAKWIIGLGLLAWLGSRIHTHDLWSALSHAVTRWDWLVAGLILTFGGLFAGAWRWHQILAVQKIRLTISRMLQVYFIGQFFNAFMFGACGGDMVRAYYAARVAGDGKKTAAATTVFMDRALGLFVQIVFGCVVIGLRLPIFLDNTGPRYAGFLMLIFLSGALVGIAALFKRHLFEHFALFRWFEEKTRVGPLIRRAYDALFLYRSHHRVLVMSAGLSLLNLLFLIYATYCFGCALSLNNPIEDYYTLFPIISVISAVPLTPGSLGVRESLFVSLFAVVFVGQAQAMLLSLLVYAGGLFWSLLGGIFYLTSTTEKERQTLPSELGV